MGNFLLYYDIMERVVYLFRAKWLCQKNSWIHARHLIFISISHNWSFWFQIVYIEREREREGRERGGDRTKKRKGERDREIAIPHLCFVGNLNTEKYRSDKSISMTNVKYDFGSIHRYSQFNLILLYFPLFLQISIWKEKVWKFRWAGCFYNDSVIIRLNIGKW